MPDFCPAGNEEQQYKFFSGQFSIVSRFVEINTRFYEQAGNRVHRKLFKTALIVLFSFRYFSKKLLAAFWNS